MYKFVQRRFHSIFALSTGSLPSALAIVRISGNESGEALAKLTGKSLDKFEHQKLFYTPLYDEKQQVIDRAMAVFLKGPRTFTGEDTAELYIHGSRAVVNLLLQTLSNYPNLEPAKAGEFTRRAFFNSKLNVAQLESLGDLLNAETSKQLRLAHKQQEAAKKLKPISDKLLQLTARLEAAIDFSEDIESQQSQNWMDEMRSQVKDIEMHLQKLVDSTQKGILIRSGFKIAFIGRPNAGKSSLMNILSTQDVAIVSKIPGTTRDSIDVRISLSNIPVTLTDTAGLRHTNEELEKEGIKRSIKRSSEAHIVVLVLAADDVLKSTIENEIDYLKQIAQLPNHIETIVCINKSDLLSKQQKEEFMKDPTGPIFTCALDETVQLLIDGLTNKISIVSNEEGQEQFLSRERHVFLLLEAISSLSAFQGSFGKDIALAAQHLKDAITSVGEISGSVVNEQILDAIFEQFCIGK